MEKRLRESHLECRQKAKLGEPPQEATGRLRDCVARCRRKAKAGGSRRLRDSAPQRPGRRSRASPAPLVGEKRSWKSSKSVQPYRQEARKHGKTWLLSSTVGGQEGTKSKRDREVSEKRVADNSDGQAKPCRAIINGPQGLITNAIGEQRHKSSSPSMNS